MRYGYALVNASHIAYCILHIASMHIAFIQGTFSRLTSLLSLSLEQNPLKALSPALLTPTLQVGNNQQSIITASMTFTLYDQFTQDMDNQQYPHVQITEAVDHHFGDGGKRYGRHNPLSLQALPRLRQFLERAPHRWTLVAIHSIVHYSMYIQVGKARMFASVIVFFLT